MNEPMELFDFPDLPDEAVIAIHAFLETFYACFQSHYFAQMHRYYHDQPVSGSERDQIPLPLPDPPF